MEPGNTEEREAAAKTPMAPMPGPHFRFLELPQELRLTVYDCLMHDTKARNCEDNTMYVPNKPVGDDELFAGKTLRIQKSAIDHKALSSQLLWISKDILQ